MQEETITCKNCGMVNDTGIARCVQCSTPLTAYGGQINGERYEGNLAAQVALLEKRPLMVSLVTGFHIFFALFWPLAFVIGSFSTRVKVSEDQTNYLAASFGSLGIIFAFITLIPLAVALFVVAWGAFTQRPWGWFASMVSMGVFLGWEVLHLKSAPLFSLLWVAVMAVGIAQWLKAEVKGWYAL